MMSGRIVAKVPLEGVSSIGLNYESYIFEVESGDKHGTKQLIKFSYRFDQRDPRLPKSFFDYSLTHTFRVTRDEDCDETWGSISNRFIFDRTGGYQGKQDALVYAKNAPVTQPDAQLTLTCYAGTPQDYRSTVKGVTQSAKAPINHAGAATEIVNADKGDSAKGSAPATSTTRKEER
jgi:hypothetical protein